MDSSNLLLIVAPSPLSLPLGISLAATQQIDFCIKCHWYWYFYYYFYCYYWYWY